MPVQSQTCSISLVVLGIVHVTPEKFENAALFVLLGLPCTEIRRENTL